MGHTRNLTEQFPETFPKLVNYVTYQIRISTKNLMQKQDRNNLTLLQTTPEVRNTVYATTRYLIAMVTTDINS